MVENHGNKANNLQVLKKAGYPVPQFISFKATSIPSLKAILSNVKAEKYAVRSSASTEDQSSSSMAGQFRTMLNLSKNEILEAVEKSLKMQQRKMKKKKTSQ